MKRILNVFWMLLLLTACAVEPQEIPQVLPQEVPEPVTVEPAEPERAEPEFSSVNPNPVRDILMKAGQRIAQANSKPLEMPAAPFVEHGAFYFPLQFVAEAMGVQYVFTDGCAYLKYDDHVTQFFIDSQRFIVDGVEGRAEGERTQFCDGLPKAPVDESFTPLLRDGIVFLPVEYLPVEFRLSYNSFGAQMCPENDNLVCFQNDLFTEAERGTALAVTLCPNVSEALVDGVRTPLPAAPFVENGIFYYPVEAVVEQLGVGYSRTGDTFRLFNAKHDVQFFLNSRQYVSDNRPGLREGSRDVFASGRKIVPVDNNYVPVERNGVVFLPSDFCDIEDIVSFLGELGYNEYPDAEMVIFTSHIREERGIGGFYLWHKFDETPRELRADLHCIGKLGEYEGAYDYEYDIIGYAGNGLNVHVLRLKPGRQNTGWRDGTISAVSTTNPEYSTPRGLRCGDMPRRAWEIYGYEFTHELYFYWSEPNGPITDICFSVLKELPRRKRNFSYLFGEAYEWFETPGFWES